MIRRMIMHGIVYATGCVFALWYLFTELFKGPDRSHWHGLGVILAVGWVFGYWGILGAFAFRRRWRAMENILRRVGERVQADADPSPEDVEEIVAVVTEMAAEENGIPRFMLRPIVRKVAARLIEQARAEARGRIAGESAHATGGSAHHED